MQRSESKFSSSVAIAMKSLPSRNSKRCVRDVASLRPFHIADNNHSSQAIQRLTGDPRLSILQDVVPEVRHPCRMLLHAIIEWRCRLPRRVAAAQSQQLREYSIHARNKAVEHSLASHFPLQPPRLPSL
jgi:hypothetical protein